MSFPTKLSEFLEIALQNLIECESDSNYVIDMSVWHRYSKEDNKCHICLSGAYLAKTIKVPFTRSVLPCELEKGVDAVAYALMNLGRGTLDYATKAIGYEKTYLGYLVIPSYNINRDVYYKAMNKIKEDLIERGY